MELKRQYNSEGQMYVVLAKVQGQNQEQEKVSVEHVKEQDFRP